MEEFLSTLKSSQQSKDMHPFFQVKDQLFQDSYNRHANHPVKILLGIYRGIEKVEIERTEKDYIKIEYGDGGNLYLPATRLESIQKYSGADGRKPKLNKIMDGARNRKSPKQSG